MEAVLDSLDSRTADRMGSVGSDRVSSPSRLRRRAFGRWLLLVLVALGASLSALPAFSTTSERTEPTLCMLPAILPFAEGDDRFERVESEATRRFERAGFTIVPSDQVGEMLDRVDEEFGDIYDPLDGAVLLDEFARYENEVEAGFRDDLGCSGRLRVSVGIVRARYANFSASWDGVSRQVNSTGRAVLMALAGVNEYGWVSASSLWVELSDLEGNLVGFRSAGIEPHVTLSLSRDMDKLPEDRWLRNDEYFQDAFDQALGSAANRMRDAGRPQGSIERDRVAWPAEP